VFIYIKLTVYISPGTNGGPDEDISIKSPSFNISPLAITVASRLSEFHELLTIRRVVSET